MPCESVSGAGTHPDIRDARTVSKTGRTANPCRRWTALTLAGLIVLLGACGQGAPPAPPAPEVGVVTTTKKTVDVVFPRVAQTESSREVEVVARVSGFLEKIAYREGSLVQEGDVMFEMDRRPFVADLEAAKGELAASKARLWTANANLKRIQPLAEADAMSQSDLDQAIGEQHAAEAAVYSAEANVTNAELNLSYTTIKAPVTGLTGQAKQREGAYLNSFSESADLSYVAQIDPIWVNFSVSQNELSDFRRQVAEGLLVRPEDDQYSYEIIMADGAVFPYRGRLDFTDPSFDNRTGTFKVRAEVPNPDFVLRPGMFVTARILGGKRPNAILLPQQAVQQTGNGNMVWVVNGKGQAEVRPVVAGEWSGHEWLINKGLKVGEQVVVEGFQKLRPNMPVKTVAAGKSDKKKPAPQGADSDQG